MATVYRAPKLTLAKDFEALRKSGKADSKQVGKLADAFKASIEKESKVIQSHMTNLVAEAKSAYANLEKISLERTTTLAGQKVDALAKLQRETVAKVRKAAEESMEEFFSVMEPGSSIKYAIETENDEKEFEELLKRLEKYFDRHRAAMDQARSPEALIVALDTRASAKMKEIMALSGGYAGDVKTFDKKIEDLGKKCAAALNGFLGCCKRMQSAKDEKEIMKHIVEAATLQKALQQAVDAFIALANKHPDPANSKVAALRSALRDNMIAANLHGMKAYEFASARVKGKNAKGHAILPDYDMSRQIARLK